MPKKSPLRFLHLEDDRADAELIASLITETWPDCTIKWVETRDGFQAALDEQEFDLVLSDYSIPSFGGMDALGLVCEKSSAPPFLFLSGTIGEDKAIEALRRGAADYIIKDRPARLVPAMKAALEKWNHHKAQGAAELRLREQAELLEKARDAICIINLEGVVTYLNKSATELFGANSEPGEGRRLEGLFGPFNAVKIPAALRELHAHGSWTSEMQLVNARDGVRHIVSRWTLVADDSGLPKSILLINSDVTEQKKLEATLLRSQRLDGIGTLAGGIAHDLNNALTPILMAVDLMRHETTDAKMLRLVAVLEKSALHGADLIRQVLAFARGSEGERAEIQLQPVFQDIVTLLKETLPRGIVIKTDIARDLWRVLGNSTQLSQVFMNLAVNARDAMAGRGTLLIRATNLAVDETLARMNPGARPGPHVLITVADTGTGIPPELLARIFDPFFTTKAAGKGTGLGLFTVLGIVRGHLGFLQVESEEGKGAEFRLFFPAVVSDPIKPPHEAMVSLPHGNSETILVIDDEPSVRAVTRALLERVGFRVVTAENGTDGILIYRAQFAEVGAVITDMMMPGLQGSEVIRELRRINPDCRIIVVSGMLEKCTDVQEEPGRLAFLAKPMTGTELIRALQLVMVDVVAGKKVC